MSTSHWRSEVTKSKKGPGTCEAGKRRSSSRLHAKGQESDIVREQHSVPNKRSSAPPAGKVLIESSAGKLVPQEQLTKGKTSRLKTHDSSLHFAAAVSHSSNPIATAGGGQSPFTATAALGASTAVNTPENVELKLQSNKDIVPKGVKFTIKGPYAHVSVVEASAALWAANEESGTIDIFSSVTGEMSTQIPERMAFVSSAVQKGRKTKPTAFKATAQHMWVGYDDGTVVIYDHLCVVQVMVGRFHESSVLAFCEMEDGITISGSVDMTLVRWDKEEKNFEAITRIVGISESHQALTCMTSFGTKIVLCGSLAGSILVVDSASGLQVATLRRHSSRVNALLVINDVLFSASEDCQINIWNMRGDDSSSSALDFQKSCKLLKCISVRLAVRDLVSHEGSHSFWVAYADGLVERWSANPDDDFGVEQVVREAFMDANELQEHETISLHCAGKVETMRVLALGSNEVSKVWCGHRNTVEECLQESITTMNAIISQDAAETAVWERKAFMLKRRELQRKEKYVRLLSRLHTRRLLLSFYDMWQVAASSHRLWGRQRKEISLSLEARHRFGLQRRYFTKWCWVYQIEQRRVKRELSAWAFQRVSLQTWVMRIISRWRTTVMLRKHKRQRQDVVNILSKISKLTFLARYFARWMCLRNNQRGLITSEKITLLAARVRHQILQHAYEGWKSVYGEQKNSRTPVIKWDTCKSGDGGASTPALVVRKGFNAAVFSQAYAKVTEERERRRVYGKWRRWHEHQRGLVLLRAMAAVKELQCNRNIIYRVFVFWQLLTQKRRLITMAQEAQKIEIRLRETEEMNADIFDKLQLQKSLDVVRQQEVTERQKLQEELNLAQKLGADRDALRRLLDRVTGVGSTEDTLGGTFTATPAHACFNPAVLQQLPVMEAMSFVMTRLKGAVLNIFTDMPLFRHIKDRLRCGTAAVIFLEGFQEVKRAVVSVCKKPAGGTWRSGDRWPIASDTFEGLPMHLCASVVQAVKTMVVAYDMVGASEVESVAGTSEEILANADHLFLLWRVSYAARKPTLPTNNRVAMRL